MESFLDKFKKEVCLGKCKCPFCPATPDMQAECATLMNVLPLSFVERVKIKRDEELKKYREDRANWEKVLSYGLKTDLGFIYQIAALDFEYLNRLLKEAGYNEDDIAKINTAIWAAMEFD